MRCAAVTGCCCIAPARRPKEETEVGMSDSRTRLAIARGALAVVALAALSACVGRRYSTRTYPQPAPPPYETHPHLYIHPGEPGYPPDDIPVDDILEDLKRSPRWRNAQRSQAASNGVGCSQGGVGQER